LTNASCHLVAGKGSYGAAYLATSKDGLQWVLKEISLHGLSKRETDTAMQEARVSESYTLVIPKYILLFLIPKLFSSDG